EEPDAFQRDGAFRLPGLRVEQTNFRRLGRGWSPRGPRNQQGLPVARGKGDERHGPPRVAFDGMPELSRVRVPDPEGAILSRTGEGLAVGGEGNAVAPVLAVPLERAEELPCGRVPELHRLVPTPAGQRLAVGRGESDPVDPIGMRLGLLPEDLPRPG